MSERTYYEWMHTLDGTANPQGPVVLMRYIPFNRASDAVKYWMEKHPESQPCKGLIECDPKRAKELAILYQYEVSYLLEIVTRMLDETREKASAKWEEAEKQPDDLLGRAHRTLMREDACRLGGEATGLSNVWQFLHARAYELQRIATMKGA